MNTQDIANLPVGDIADKDCVLFLWATYPKLEDALAVVKGWGFRFKTVAFTWVKLNPSGKGYHFGLGYWTRQGTELCLLATRGKPKRVNNSIANLVIAPRGEHSSKPKEVRDRIVQLMGPLPRVELFARGMGKIDNGWVNAGLEIDGQDIRVALEQIKNDTYLLR